MAPIFIKSGLDMKSGSDNLSDSDQVSDHYINGTATLLVTLKTLPFNI